MSEEKEKRAIITPGPELRDKVDKLAARLSEFEKPKADKMVASILSSPRRNEFLFAESSHIFYPYFLSKLTEFTLHPENRPQKAAKAEKGSAPAAATVTTTSSVTTTADGNVIRSGGTVIDTRRQEILRQAEEEARRYLVDPYPPFYSLDLKDGTIDLPATATDFISLTAQYTAKYGEPFLNSVTAKYRRNPDFRFLVDDDVRHPVFKGLVKSYEKILNFDEEQTETRLEQYGKQDYLLQTVVKEKTRYVKAALARRKAELLTDEELKAKLNWTNFKVLCSFTLSDLSLDGVIPETAASQQYFSHSGSAPAQASVAVEAKTSQPEEEAPTSVPKFTPTFMSSHLTRGGVPAPPPASSPAVVAAPALVPEEDPTSVTADGDYDVDPITGARAIREFTLYIMEDAIRVKYNEYKERIMGNHDPTADPRYHQDIINRSLLHPDQVKERVKKNDKAAQRKVKDPNPTGSSAYYQDAINRCVHKNAAMHSTSETKGFGFGLGRIKEAYRQYWNGSDPPAEESAPNFGAPYSFYNNIEGEQTYYFSKSTSPSSSHARSSNERQSRSTKYSSSPDYQETPPLRDHSGTNMNVANNNANAAFRYYHLNNCQSDSKRKSLSVDLVNRFSVPVKAPSSDPPPFVIERMQSVPHDSYTYRTVYFHHGASSPPSIRKDENSIPPECLPATVPPFVLETMESIPRDSVSYRTYFNDVEEPPAYVLEDMSSIVKHDGRSQYVSGIRSPSPATSNMESRLMETPAQRWHQFICKCLPHLGTVGTCALYGNVYVETGGTFDPLQKQKYGVTHDAIGLFQMNPAMRQYFEKYCAEFYIKSYHRTAAIVTTPSTAREESPKTLDPDTMDAQLTFVLSEIASGSFIGPGNAAKIRKAFYLICEDRTSSTLRVVLPKKEGVSPSMIERATEVFCDVFERPSVPHMDRRREKSLECWEYVREQGLHLRLA